MIKQVKNSMYQKQDNESVQEFLENRLTLELEDRLEMITCISEYCGGYRGPVNP